MGQIDPRGVLREHYAGTALPSVSVLDNLIRVGIGPPTNPSTVGQVVAAINGHYNAGALVQATVVSGNSNTQLVGGPYAPIELKGLGSSFATATDLKQITSQNVIVHGVIDPKSTPCSFRAAMRIPATANYMKREKLRSTGTSRTTVQTRT